MAQPPEPVSDTTTLNDQSGALRETYTSMPDFTLKKRPWRRYTTPWELIVSHKYEGEGTEEKPYIVDWLPATTDKEGSAPTGGDLENPMTWNDAYRWAVVMSVAVATLAVAMASSTL